LETEALEIRKESGMRLTVGGVMEQIRAIQDVMSQAMHEGEHYGKIPGCGDKPALLKAGAEKLGLMFRLAPEFEVTAIDLADNHKEFRIICTLKHIQTGETWGQGVGSCSTMESKYRYRPSSRKCPACGAEAIIKGKAEFGGGWVCFKKKGGCGAKFSDEAKDIVSQTDGRIENPDIADTYNTVLKMAKKRAHVDAIITATSASDIFTQDVEEPLLDTEGEVPVVQAEKNATQAPVSANKANPAPIRKRNAGGKEPLPNLTPEQRARSEKEFRLREFVCACCDVQNPSKPTPEEAKNLSEKFKEMTGKEKMTDLSDAELDEQLNKSEVKMFESIGGTGEKY
jgi:hypothetical protein